MTDKWNKEINTDKILEILENMRLGMGLVEKYYRKQRAEALRLKKQEEKRERNGRK